MQLDEHDYAHESSVVRIETFQELARGASLTDA